MVKLYGEQGLPGTAAGGHGLLNHPLWPRFSRCPEKSPPEPPTQREGRVVPPETLPAHQHQHHHDGARRCTTPEGRRRPNPRRPKITIWLLDLHLPTRPRSFSPVRVTPEQNIKDFM